MRKVGVWKLCVGLFTLVGLAATSSEFRVPGLNYPAQTRDEISILPGGRVVRPFGRQVPVGTAPFAIGVSPTGRTIVTANIGISMATGVERPSLTVIVPGKKDTPWNLLDFAAAPRQPRIQAWQGLTGGLVVTGDSSAWVSEGDSGRIVEVSLSTGTRKSAVTLNSDDYPGSFIDGLIYDRDRNLLIALDPANSRAVVVDAKRGVVLSSVKTKPFPRAAALSSEGKRLYIACAGEQSSGASLSIIDLANPATPKGTLEVRLGGHSPAGIAVVKDQVYVSMAQDDNIAVVNGSTGKLDAPIELRIAGLETYRGVTPAGMAVDSGSGKLLVAESGINAVALVDPGNKKMLGHIAAGWFPTSIAILAGQVYVAAARGTGTGPSTPAHRIHMVGAGHPQSFEADTAVLKRGIVSSFTLPDDKELAHQTDIVMQANGFARIGTAASTRPVPPVRHLVMIVKGNRSFDEILGDVERAGDRVVLSEPRFARFGSDGYIPGGKNRFSLHLPVTPNHHELASRWAFSDNFYTDADNAEGGYRWLTGCWPDPAGEAFALYQEAGNHGPSPPKPQTDLWQHLQQHKVDVLRFPSPDAKLEGATDLQRADEMIAALRRDYLDDGKPLPQMLFIRLPGDGLSSAPLNDAYRYEASYIAANDYALGRIVEFLSNSPWWKDMAIFTTESGADGGADHVDSHRTLLLASGPWARTGYVSHNNTSAPALLRTVFKIFNIPSMSLYDASAGDLLDLLSVVPDFSRYQVLPEDPRLFDAANVR